MTDTVLVTGATGTVGRHVSNELAERDYSPRVGLRDPGVVPESLPDVADVVEFDFVRPETWGAALRGVDGLFLMRPPTVDADTVSAFAEAAARVGVARIAYLSTLGAERNPLIPHHRIEQRVVATDADHTLLRASFFMQNLAEVHREDIVEHDEIFVPAGTGETSFVDARDIAAVAATVLTEPGHENRSYDITGPEALSYADVAAVFSDVLGRRITYPEPSLVAFVRRSRGRGYPLPFIAVMCAIYTTARLGLADRVTDDTRELLGREPRRIRAFVEDYAAEFRPETAQ
ncbi:SDR family oxidoreductase [Halolamina litorea]|uniref:SDR family oxidoreductase n=1 Tax=Halolamina litorea TaxID=1515593 RepID=A0ABD6BMM5_9EURY|nr:SDR family oxidoreductase [Halolamina litorea]